MEVTAGCPKGDECALNRGAVFCFHCRRPWPPDETWDLPLASRPERPRGDAFLVKFDTAAGLMDALASMTPLQRLIVAVTQAAILETLTRGMEAAPSGVFTDATRWQTEGSVTAEAIREAWRTLDARGGLVEERVGALRPVYEAGFREVMARAVHLCHPEFGCDCGEVVDAARAAVREFEAVRGIRFPVQFSELYEALTRLEVALHEGVARRPGGTGESPA